MQLKNNVYLASGYNTISFGSGRKEFNPKKAMPSFENYLKEAGEHTLGALDDVSLIDEAVISNFIAARFIRQANLPGFIPFIHPDLAYKPATRVEGACASGGLALATSTKAVLSGMADIVFCVGFEIQNTIKAIYGADYLASAGYYSGERKNGHAYFFPNKFSQRAGAYFGKYDRDKARSGMAHWYAQMIESARKSPKAQEYHNTTNDLIAAGMTPANPKSFVDHLNVFDCSKVSDGASSILFLNDSGLKKSGIPRNRCAKLAGIGQATRDITRAPADPTILDTTRKAVERALTMAGLTITDIGYLELHDCFTITAMLAMESIGLADRGNAADLIISGVTKSTGKVPTNATGGLIGFGHYVGGTGIRQAVDILDQLTDNAGETQVKIDPKRPYALSVSMGGNDVTVVSMIYTRA